MDLRFQCSFGAIEHLGHLGIREAVNVTEDDCGPLSRRKRSQDAGPRLPGLVTGDGIDGRFGCRLEGQLGCLNPPDTRPVAADVEQDRGKPAAKAEIPDPAGVVARERPVRPDERVLSRLFGIAAVAQDPKRDREQPIFVGSHECPERSVEIDGKIGEEA